MFSPGFGDRTETKSGMKTRSWNEMPVVALAAFGLFVALAGYADRAQAASTDVTPAGVVAPAQADLPPVPAEALRMSQAGMSDDVITAYIQKSANPYTLDAEQIIYLHDVGISSTVLDTLVTHGGIVSGNLVAAAPNEAADAGNVSATATPPVSGPAAGFYNSLAPYGTWLNVPGYGWCWQPTVVLADPAWQPYCNNGSWLWTDQGWYWNSYYSWGWAPFHYGRWCQSPGHGWVWCPDNTWGPAWVCWRDYPGYCGWAPLPPGACFVAGTGWTFNGLAVGFNFGFGLGARCFTFCDFDDFCGRHAFAHFRHGHDADRFFHDSRVDNDFALDAHHRFFNRGIDPSRIEAATHTHIGQVSVRELPQGSGDDGDFDRPDRLVHSGNDQVIFRPGQDLSAMQNQFRSDRHMSSANHWDNDTATHGFTAGHDVGNTTGLQPGHSNTFQHSPPNVSMKPSYGNAPNRQWNGTGPAQVRSSLPASGYQRNGSASWGSTPAPAWHPAPSQSWNRDAQNSGGTRSWNGGSQNWGGGSQSWNGGTPSWGGGSPNWGGGMSSGHSYHR
jgi:hypothetical protein